MKIDTAQMQSAADAASELLKALANRHRLLILKLRVLKRAAIPRRDDLVDARRDGQTIWYSISSAPARELVEVLYRSFCAPSVVCRPKKSAATRSRKG